MKKLLALTLATALAVTGWAQTQKEFVAHLTKVESAAIKAFEKKDIKWFENASSADFTYTAHDGAKSDKKTSMAGMTQMFGMAEKIKVFQKRGAVSLKGSTGTAVYDGTFHVTMKPGPDKKTHVMTIKGKTKETWKKVGSQWKLTNITDIGPQTYLMDGKPMNTGGGG